MCLHALTRKDEVATVGSGVMHTHAHLRCNLGPKLAQNRPRIPHRARPVHARLIPLRTES
jgi:hypothetical protein